MNVKYKHIYGNTLRKTTTHCEPKSIPSLVDNVENAWRLTYASSHVFIAW
jgi:hypothetical protein